MAEIATTPTDVAPAASPEPSFDDKLANKLFGEDSTADGDAAADNPPADAAPDTGDGEPEVEIPAEEEAAAPKGDVELVHNGQRIRVSQEQARNLAQMGYDYSSKMQALNADKARNQQVAQALQAQGQLQAQLLDHASVVRAFDMQLSQYGNADWVKLSQDDPIGYSQARAQFDALRERRNVAYSQMAQAFQHLQQTQGYVSQEQRATEFAKLQERVPEWRDQARYNKESDAIYSTLLSDYGYSQAELSGNPVLEDSRAIAILRDAWRYRQAVAASRNKNQGKVPGVARPGVAQARSGADNVGILTKQLHQTKDPAKKKAVFDVLLNKKLFG